MLIDGNDRSEPDLRLATVLAGPWKLIRTRSADGAEQSVELYHRHRDPSERADETEAQPAVVERLLALLDAQEAEATLESTRVEIGDEMAETLRALGYVN